MFVIPWMCDYSDTTLFSICQNESVRIFSIDELEMIIRLYAINASSHYYQNAWHMYLRMFNDHILIRSDYAVRWWPPGGSYSNHKSGSPNSIGYHLMSCPINSLFSFNRMT